MKEWNDSNICAYMALRSMGLRFRGVIHLHHRRPTYGVSTNFPEDLSPQLNPVALADAVRQWIALVYNGSDILVRKKWDKSVGDVWNEGNRVW